MSISSTLCFLSGFRYPIPDLPESEASVRRNALVVHHCSDDDLGYKSNSKSIIILIIVFISCAFTSKLYLINIKMCTNYLNINQNK